MSSVAQQKWTFTSLWNVKITVDDGEIKLFESNQKPDHKRPPRMPPHSQAPMDHPGEGENWEEEMKLQQQEREALSVLGTHVRLSGGFGMAAGPDLTQAGNVPQAWPGWRPASGWWRKQKGFWIRSAFQPGIQTCSGSSESEKCQVDRLSLLTLAFMFPCERGLVWVIPLKINTELRQRQVVGLLVVSAALDTQTVSSLQSKSLNFKPPNWNINTRFAVTRLLWWNRAIDLSCVSSGGAKQGADGTAEITDPCTPIIIMLHRRRSSQQRHAEAITGNLQDGIVW